MPFLTALAIEPYSGREWRLARPLMYEFPDGTALLTVEAGFICDLESTPWYIRWYLPEDSAREPAAVVHDWLYRTQLYSREMSDRIFRTVLQDLGVSEDRIHRLYLGVRKFGGRAWEENTRRRALGAP